MSDVDMSPRGGYIRGILLGISFCAGIFIVSSTVSYLDGNRFTAGKPATSETPVVKLQTTPAIVAAAPQTADATNSTTPAMSVTVDAPTTETASTSDLPTDPLTAAPENSAPAFNANVSGLATNTVEQGSGIDLAAPAMQTTPALNATAPSQLGVAQNDTTVVAANTESTRPTITFDGSSPTLNSVDTAQPNRNLVPLPTTGAFAKFSQSFADDGSRPLVSIVLRVTDVQQAAAAAGLAASVTLALPAENRAVALDIANAYRQIGGESLLLLPDSGANAFAVGDDPSKVDAVLGAMLTPDMEVIGVIDGPNGNIVDDDVLASAAVDALGRTGHAVVVTSPSGIDRVEEMAGQQGVPASTALTSIASLLQQSSISSRVSQAVSTIGAHGTTIIYGEANPATIAALTEWLRGGQAAQVSLAPVSAVIQRKY